MYFVLLVCRTWCHCYCYVLFLCFASKCINLLYFCTFYIVLSCMYLPYFYLVFLLSLFIYLFIKVNCLQYIDVTFVCNGLSTKIWVLSFHQTCLKVQQGSHVLASWYFVIIVIICFMPCFLQLLLICYFIHSLIFLIVCIYYSLYHCTSFIYELYLVLWIVWYSIARFYFIWFFFANFCYFNYRHFFQYFCFFICIQILHKIFVVCCFVSCFFQFYLNNLIVF